MKISNSTLNFYVNKIHRYSANTCTKVALATKNLLHNKLTVGLCLLFLLVVGKTWADNPILAWAKNIGGTGAAEAVGFKVTTDSLGNVFTIGLFFGTVDFDPGPGVTNLTSNSHYSYFISKINATGDLVWVKQFGGTLKVPSALQQNSRLFIALDAGGNILITGSFLGGAYDFDPGPSVLNFNSPLNFGMFISKLDPSGNLLWAKEMVGTHAGTYIRPVDMKLDSYGNMVIAGSCGIAATNPDSIDFDPGLGTYKLRPATDDGFISKLDPSGNLIWAKLYIAAINSKIAVNVSDAVYIMGAFAGTIDFNPGTKPSDTFFMSNIPFQLSGGVFVCKLDKNANFLWAKQFGIGHGSSSYTSAQSISIEKNTGYIYTTNAGPGDYDPGPNTFNTTLNNGPIVISKYDSNLNFIWVKQIGAPGTSLALNTFLSGALYSCIDKEGNIYVSTNGYGLLNATVNMAPFPDVFNITMVGKDILVTGLDSSGNFRWAGSIGGTASDEVCRDITTNTQGYVYITGYFNGTTDFDPDTSTILHLTASGAMDAFIQKIGQCYDPVTQNLVICSNQLPYTWNGITVPAAGTAVATYTTLSTMGCDSITFLSLTANPAIATTQNITICSNQLPYTWLGKTVTTGGTAAATFTALSATGCDSTVTLNLTVNPTSIHTQPIAICNNQLPYTWNGISVATGGTAVATFTTSNSSGCDSVVTLNLAVNDTVAVTENISICTSDLPYTWNGIVVNSGGQDAAIYTSTNSVGCDSVVTLNLAINDSVFYTITDSACGSYALNGQTYTTSGTYNQLFKNVNGCDSILTLHLTITTEANSNVVQSDATLTAEATNVTYQWINCDNGNTPIQGAISQSFSPTVSGRYAVVITEDACVDTSFCFTVTTTAIRELAKDNTITVYPNPTEGMLNLESARHLHNAFLRFLSITGKVLYSHKNVQGKTFDFDISTYAKGIYFVELKEGENTTRLKVVKK